MKPSPDLTYRPDYACPPGEVIQEYLDTLEISARELARRCGRSGKLIAEIVSGKAPVEPETALQLERVLGLSALIWSRLEATYQLHVARQDDRQALAASYDWAKKFPIKELVDRKRLSTQTDKSRIVEDLITFFGAGSVKACDDRIKELINADFRTSPTFTSETEALAAWLRIGELEASSRRVPDYNREFFVKKLSEIRALTVEPLPTAIPKLTEMCAESGVVFVLEPSFSKVRASGVSRWLSPRKALIQQSLRYMADDHFWFTFFHECAHLLLHSRKRVFIDSDKGPGSAEPKQESEANLWAADFLIPDATMKKFLRTFSGDEREVVRLAGDCGIAPGIIVGQLHHRRIVPFNALNRLIKRYKWSSDT